MITMLVKIDLINGLNNHLSMMQQFSLQQSNIRFRFLNHPLQVLPVVQIVEKNQDDSQGQKHNRQVPAHCEAIQRGPDTLYPQDEDHDYDGHLNVEPLLYVARPCRQQLG